MKLINSSEELRTLFNIDPNSDYIEPTNFIDGSIGFSTKRYYPPNLRYKAPVNQQGKPDTLAMIHVLLDPNQEKDATKDRLIIHISSFGRYRAKKYDYNFSDPECPTEESILLSRNTPKPIDLENVDSYFYDRVQGKLSDEKGKIVSGIDILNELYNKHCDTVHLIKGLPLRTKILTSRRLSNFYEKIYLVLEYLLKNIWNREIVKQDKNSFFLYKVSLENLRLSSIDSISIFGYKISETIAVVYSALILLLFSFFFLLGIEVHFMKVLLSNVLLTTCFVIFSLYLLNNFIPNSIMLRLINLSLRLKWYYIWKKHKV